MSRLVRFAVIVLLIACNAGSQSPATLPQATVPPAAKPIFDDDFSAMAQPRHWPVGEDGIARSAYVSGAGYQLTQKKAGTTTTLAAPMDWIAGDLLIEATVASNAGIRALGVLCAVEPGKTRYYLVTFRDAAPRIGVVRDGPITWLTTSRESAPSTTKIQASCAGGGGTSAHFGLWIDGHSVAEVDDPSVGDLPVRWQPGIIIDADEGATIVFKRFTVALVSSASQSARTLAPSHQEGTDRFSLVLPAMWNRIELDPAGLERTTATISDPQMRSVIRTQAPALLSSGAVFAAWDLAPERATPGFATGLIVYYRTVPPNTGLDLVAQQTVAQLEARSFVTRPVKHSRVTLTSGAAERFEYAMTAQSTSGATITCVTTAFFLLSGTDSYVLSFGCPPTSSVAYVSMFDEIAQSFTLKR